MTALTSCIDYPALGEGSDPSKIGVFDGHLELQPHRYCYNSILNRCYVREIRPGYSQSWILELLNSADSHKGRIPPLAIGHLGVLN